MCRFADGEVLLSRGEGLTVTNKKVAVAEARRLAGKTPPFALWFRCPSG